jgi:hypothetical protein
MEEPKLPSRHDLEMLVIHGEAAARFAADPSIRQVLSGLRMSYFNNWQSSQDVHEREKLHAQASALSDIENALDAVKDAGIGAKVALDQRRYSD